MDIEGLKLVNKALGDAEIGAKVQTRVGVGQNVPYVTIGSAFAFRPGDILNVLDEIGAGERRIGSPNEGRVMELVAKMQGADSITFIDLMAKEQYTPEQA